MKGRGKEKNPGSDLGTLAEVLKLVTEDLKSWSRNTFGHVTKQLESLRGDLEKLERDDLINNRDAILNTKRELDELLYREEMMWLQRSRVSWLKEGDRNTKYFHRKARWQTRKNYIKKLKREDGTWCSNQLEMRGMAVNHFSNLFLKDGRVNPQELVDLFETSITDDMQAV